MVSARNTAAPPRRAIDGGLRLLHWLTVALLLLAFGLAWGFDSLPPGPAAGQLVTLHRTVGLSLFGLTAARLAWRQWHPLPPVPAPAWERWLAGTVQAALYSALLAQPLLGWAASGAQGDSVAFAGLLTLPDLVDPDPDRADQLLGLHKLLGFTILALVGLHVTGALRHAIRRDGVLHGMLGRAKPAS
ncbi:cytochrome b/b6 domain-containing protein [Lichenihabitans sp. Uapishka_5]|uniref:cytochrome b n=1 Tax=Lichenihabitans sp. Uapishka_5 TaxID=3037302 RepID=UPI0029E80E81|nr:cytochrome b/b6 domain-containing protein [Lichenihabitans sp. Uapishka_5]MDX7953764.1 cytochrome b/b6 domain-containing protein [Lichenihabitans sp. Uapishka_5]